jgi:hypothetical protein
VTNQPRIVVIQSGISPFSDDLCAQGNARCHQLEGINETGYTCPVFHRKLHHSFNPFQVRRLNNCKRGEERNKELFP